MRSHPRCRDPLPCRVGAHGLVAVAMLVLVGMTSAAEAALTNDSFAQTVAGACKDGVCTGPVYAGPGGVNSLHDFGDVTYGAPNGALIGNGFDAAESLNAQDHFGLFARGSTNSTAEPGAGTGWASGSFSLSVLIPPQQGHAAGTPGTLILPYHLHGTVTIDWGEVFIDGMLASGASAHLLWDITTFNVDGTGSEVHHMANDTWSGNDVSVTVDRNVAAQVSFTFGTIFYISAGYYVTVNGYSLGPPAIGFVEADFLHTATLGPVTVEDGSAALVPDPVIVTDTGFAFATESSGGGTSLDRFLCYKSKSTTIFPKGGHVALRDRFESKNFAVTKPLDLCAPADGGGGVTDAATHLEAFQIKESKKTCAAGSPSNAGGVCARETDCGGTKGTTFCQKTSKHVPQIGVKVENALGTLLVDTVKPERLLVPTAESSTGPVAAPADGDNAVDRFKCYTVTVTKGTPKFALVAGTPLQDQFIGSTPKLFDLKKPTRLCTAVGEDAHAIKNPDALLLCYQAVPAKGQPKHVPVKGVFIANEFGPAQVDTIKEDEVCLPSTVGG
jgi:hypothetical protein